MELQTERLILRPWKDEDAKALYEYARDPRVGPIAGWPPHTSVENSRDIIREILSVPETYAVILKETGNPVGSVGIMFGDKGSAPMKEKEAEIGYWIGVPYWGMGLIPEAVKELQRRCFENLGCERLWCGYYDGNEKSRRVQEKCGFRYDHTRKDQISPLGDKRTEHFTSLTREEWRFHIRTAELFDAKELLQIYAPYVTDTAISFEYEVPVLEDFEDRIKKVLTKYPYLVAVEKGKIVGYAYAAPFKEREAYDWSVETSIYMEKGARGKGYGKKLYLALEQALKEQNILNMNACIAYTEIEDEFLTNQSARFHKAMGFHTVGKFSQCGYKFERWYDMIWMEKLIGEHSKYPGKIEAYKKR